MDDCACDWNPGSWIIGTETNQTEVSPKFPSTVMILRVHPRFPRKPVTIKKSRPEAVTERMTSRYFLGQDDVFVLMKLNFHFTLDPYFGFLRRVEVDFISNSPFFKSRALTRVGGKFKLIRSFIEPTVLIFGNFFFRRPFGFCPTSPLATSSKFKPSSITI